MIASLVLAGCGSEAVPEQLAAPAAVRAVPEPGVSAAPEPVDAATPTAGDVGAGPTSAPQTDAGEDADPEDIRAVEQSVRDYYAAINRAQYEGDVAGLEAMSLPECPCREVPASISRLLLQGEIEQAQWVLHSVSVTDVSPPYASVHVSVSVSDGVVITPAGEVVTTINNLGDANYDHGLVKDGTRWITAQVLES